MSKRFNIFCQVHKALKAMLYDTAISLQLADLSIKEEASAAFEKLNVTLSLLENHALQEEKFILSYVHRFDNKLVDAFRKEHQKEAAMTEKLKALVALYYTCVADEDRQETGEILLCKFNELVCFHLIHMNCEEILLCKFNELVCFHLIHMNCEETSLNRLLWNELSDQQILQLTRLILNNIPADIRLIQDHWMFRSISNSEIIEWMSKVKDHASDEIFNSLLQIAEKILHPDRWQKVKEALSEGVMVT
jgi:hypothetical protein